MVKHVILWKLKNDVEDVNQVKLKIKNGLEGLLGKIEGLVDIKVIIDGLQTSTADVLLDSTFESFSALGVYANHPLHLEVANGVVRPNAEIRLCMDYEE